MGAFVRIGVVVAALAALAMPAAAGADPPDREDAVQVFNRDVFFIDHVTLRNPTAETPPEEPLYSDFGGALDVTWGEWSAANATARAQRIGRRTDVRIALSGLIPNGVYSLFYGTLGPDSENPKCPGVERTLPLNAFHPAADAPDAASFIADGTGAAAFRARLDGAPLDAHTFFYSVIYHFDGMTYGDLPNRGEFITQGPNCRSSFGHDAMRQLVVFQKFG